MTPRDFDNEVKYRAALSIFQLLFDKGWLTKKELALLNRQLVEKYQPIIGSL
jgi:hypothetical protein